MAAAAAPKLPLAIRKEVRDNEEKKSKILSEGSAAIGSPVTFNFDLDSTYANLASNSMFQPRVVPISLTYLENALKAVQKSYKDAMVKDELEAGWTTHNVDLLVLTSDKELEALKADKSTVGSSYFRLRLHDGNLQIVTSAQYFASNLPDIAVLDLTPLASHASAQSTASPGATADELPLEIRKKMRDVQPKVDASLGSIRKLKGLEDASFDLEQQTRACYPKLKDNTGATVFTPEAFPQYLDQLAALLTKQWKDEMVSEALLEEWKAPHAIELQPEVDLEKETGAKLVKDGRYNAVKLEGGKLLLLQGKGMWKTNMNNIPGIDVVKML